MVEQVNDVSKNALIELKEAIHTFNQTKSRNYYLHVAEVMGQSEMDTLISDFRLHRKKMEEKAAKAEEARLKNAKLERENRAKLAQERKLKRLAKAFGLSMDEVRTKFGK